MKVGFDTIDFGSFVSPKVVPQMRDTANVLKGLDLNSKSSKLLSIVANIRGATDACSFQEISYLGYPLSVSEIFQKRNTNKTISQAFDNVKEIQDLVLKHNKNLVVYLSMAFGNPYNEVYHTDIVSELAHKLNNIEIKTISLSDTIGASTTKNIKMLFKTLIYEYSTIEFGAHFHTNIDNWREKVDEAYKSGCKRFDSALNGFGGCPMANDNLVGNLPTEKLILYFGNKLDLNLKEFSKSLKLSEEIFSNK